MPIILAIEPDRRQAAHLTGIVRQRIGAELILADTTEGALDAIGNRIPDMVLVPAFLSPQDDAALAAALRVIAAAAHVRTLTIPVLSSGVKQTARGGILARWRRARAESPAPDGCDPAVFAEQITAYLKEAAAERADLEVGETAAIAPTVETAPVEMPVTAAFDPAPLASAAAPADEGWDALGNVEGAIDLSAELTRLSDRKDDADVAPRDEHPAVEPAAVFTIDAAVGEAAQALDEIVAMEAAAPAFVLGETAVIEGAAPVPALDETAVIEAAAPVSALGETAVIQAVAPVPVPEEAIFAEADLVPVPEETVVEIAAEEAARPRADVTPWTAMYLTPGRMWPTLEGVQAEALPPFDECPPEPEPIAARPRHLEWTELVASLRQDVERRAEPMPASAPPAAARTASVAAARGSRPDAKQKGRGKHVKPAQDEWGFFDPEQCGFAALLAKLEEITVSSDPADDDARRSA